MLQTLLEMTPTVTDQIAPIVYERDIGLADLLFAGRNLFSLILLPVCSETTPLSRKLHVSVLNFVTVLTKRTKHCIEKSLHRPHKMTD